MGRKKRKPAKTLNATAAALGEPNSSVNTFNPLEEERAFCEKLLKLADTALQMSARELKKAS